MSAYKEYVSVRSPVGKSKRDHGDLITDMLLDIMKRPSEPCQTEVLMQEVEHLTFHSALTVRQAFSCYLSGKCKQNPTEFFKTVLTRYMEKHLCMVGFQRDKTDISEREVGEKREECSWMELVCSVGSRQAEGAVYVPKAGCLGKSADDILRCVSDHPRKAESLSHQRSLDNLKLLSPGCDNIIQLLVYQIQPFPFYIHEAVDYRLLQFLCDRRNYHKWISTASLVRVVEDVTKALKYMLSKGMVTAGITAYFMNVDLGSATTPIERQSNVSLQNFTVKIADLSLARRAADRAGTGFRVLKWSSLITSS